MSILRVIKDKVFQVIGIDVDVAHVYVFFQASNGLTVNRYWMVNKTVVGSTLLTLTFFFISSLPLSFYFPFPTFPCIFPSPAFIAYAYQGRLLKSTAIAYLH